MGGAGDDILTGGDGYDTSYLQISSTSATTGSGTTIATTGATASCGIDTITDFASGIDQIAVHIQGASTGTLSSTAFALSTETATTSTRFLFDANSGVLSYDADGSGSGAAIDIATLDGLPNITASDIHLV
jgi:Ca2+-binding RTX toxin-like protein